MPPVWTETLGQTLELNPEQYQAFWEAFRARALEERSVAAGTWPLQWAHWNATIKPAIDLLMRTVYTAGVKAAVLGAAEARARAEGQSE